MSIGFLISSKFLMLILHSCLLAGWLAGRLACWLAGWLAAVAASAAAPSSWLWMSCSSKLSLLLSLLLLILVCSCCFPLSSSLAMSPQDNRRQPESILGERTLDSVLQLFIWQLHSCQTPSARDVHFERNLSEEYTPSSVSGAV